MASNELLVRWLNDAYAMEEALIPILENHAEDLEGRPEMAGRMRQHVEETRNHRELVRGCLARLGEEPSTSKSVLGKMMGNLQAPATGIFEDENVKNGLSDYATEHFEIASYTALIHAARELGETDVADVCERIRSEEEEMARWLEESLPKAVKESLHAA